jgi:uncharacterized membrane protein YfcA
MNDLGAGPCLELVALGIGVVLGAQIGARLSERIMVGWIIKGLAGALGLVGVRILTMAL